MGDNRRGARAARLQPGRRETPRRGLGCGRHPRVRAGSRLVAPDPQDRAVTIIAFAGPSLSAEDRPSFGSVVWQPPAEAGALTRPDIDAPPRFCLTHGYFAHRPALRHKQILPPK